MADIALLGMPIQEGSGRLGCNMGPMAYHAAELARHLCDLDHRVTDHGLVGPDAADDLTPHPHLKRLPAVAGWARSIHRHARRLAAGPAVPVYLGGDHALSLGTVTAHAAHAAGAGRPQFVLWLDAHADFNTFATTETGNLHGTPLAFATGAGGMDAYLGGPVAAPVAPGHVCIMGLRSIDSDERSLVRRAGVTVHDMRSLDENGVVRPLAAFLDRVARANGFLHVSLDVDFIDPLHAPAVGTTVPGGVTVREAHLVMEVLHDSRLVTSMDMVELNPFLDDRGKTARLMVDLCASLMGRRVMDRPTLSF